MKIHSFLLITSIFFFIHLPGHAQTEKGSRLLGGGGFLRSSDGSFSTYINPDLGFFLVDNLAVGASLPLFYRFDHFSWFNSLCAILCWRRPDPLFCFGQYGI